MSRDFTFDAYAELLAVLDREGVEPLTVREYVGHDDLPDRFAVLRHDVDRKIDNALRMARLEAARDVASTYYFRVPATFDPALLERVEALGHEVGYHYEDLDRADGDELRARDAFRENLRRVRAVCDVDTVCMHGNPLTPHDNRDMWPDPPRFDDYDLLGEAYLSMDFDDVTYFSDTGRTWRDGKLKVKDHTRGEGDKTIRAATTGDLVDLVSHGAIDRACLLVHPDRWADTGLEQLENRLRDGAVNAVKRGMYYLP